MLSGQTIQLLVIGGVVGAVAGFLAGVPYLKKKGININRGVDTANNAVNLAEPVINIADTLLPNNPVVNVLKIIEKWAKIAAGNAEQLTHAGDINKEERAEVAESVVNAVLKELNIDVNDNRKILIDAAIKDVVNDFGHTDPSEAERQAKEQALQNQVSQLTTENANLKNAITTAANTAQVTTQTVSNVDQATTTA